MTNEEIVIRIQDGETDLYSVLWDKTKKLIFQIMRSKIYNTPLPSYVTVDDLEQEMYFALCKAVNYFDREKHALFTSYLNYPILTVLRYALFSDKSLKNEKSYNEVVQDRDGHSIEKWDLLADPKTESSFYDIELNELQETVRQAVAKLKEHERAAVSLFYFHGLTYSAIADHLHIGKARAEQLIHNGLSHLRRNPDIINLHGEHIRHITEDEADYQICASDWIHSSARLVAEIELSARIEKGEFLSYGKRIAYLRTAKNRFINDKLKELADIRRGFFNNQGK